MSTQKISGIIILIISILLLVAAIICKVGFIMGLIIIMIACSWASLICLGIVLFVEG